MRVSGNEMTEVAADDAVLNSAAFLGANSRIYEWLVKRAQREDRGRRPEIVLGHVASAARFAATFHPGRFADGAIENIALEIGMGIPKLVSQDRGFVLPATRKQNQRRILHVTSHLLAIGGHTRMLHHWVRNDRSSHHSVVTVNQGNVAIPGWLSDAVRSSGGDLVALPSEAPLCQKAGWLREIARQTADLVVLHHDGCDVVPTVAFGGLDCPPVAVLNHADHVFWLGSSVSDMVINLRTAGSEHTSKRRFVSSNCVIPIPLENPVSHVSQRDARRTLSIPGDQIVLLSIGRAEKYRSCGSYDFVATAWKILDRHPHAHLYVVGESSKGIVPHLRCPLHERLHFVGTIEDPSLYRSAADIYLESFPFGSQTALLEAALSGLPVVPAYAPLFPLLVANDDAILDLLPNPANEEEYVASIELLIKQPKRRLELGEALRKRLLFDHVGEGWLDRLDKLYQHTDGLRHGPRQIPTSPCSTLAADIALSLWHVRADGKTNCSSAPGGAVVAELRHHAFVAKYVDNYGIARRMALSAVWIDPYRWTSWRLLIITVLGKLGRLFRRAASRA